MVKPFDEYRSDIKNPYNRFQNWAKTEGLGWNKDEVNKRYDLWKNGKPYLDDAAVGAAADALVGGESPLAPIRPGGGGGGAGIVLQQEFDAAGADGADEPDAEARSRGAFQPLPGKNSWNAFQAHYKGCWTTEMTRERYFLWKGGKAHLLSAADVDVPAKDRFVAKAGVNVWNQFQAHFKGRWSKAELRTRYHQWAATGSVALPAAMVDEVKEDDEDADEEADAHEAEPALDHVSVADLVRCRAVQDGEDLTVALPCGRNLTLRVCERDGQWGLASGKVWAAHPLAAVQAACTASHQKAPANLGWHSLKVSTGATLDEVVTNFLRDNAERAAVPDEGPRGGVRAAGPAPRCRGTAARSGKQCGLRTRDASGLCYAHRSEADPPAAPAAPAASARLWCLFMGSPGAIPVNDRNGVLAEHLDGVDRDKVTVKEWLQSHDHTMLADSYVAGAACNDNPVDIICRAFQNELFEDDNQTLMLVYSGHGDGAASRKGAFCFPNNKYVRPRDILPKWTEAQSLRGNKGSRLVIVVDACHSGYWVDYVKRHGHEHEGVAVQAACGSDELASDGGVRGGGALITALFKSSDPRKSVRTLPDQRPVAVCAPGDVGALKKLGLTLVSA